MKFLKISACLLLALFFCAFSHRIMAGEDPVDCIEEIGIAIDAADADTFQELVDLDSVLQNGLTAFLQEANKPENASKLPPLAAMLVQQMSDSGSAGNGLRSLVLDQMRSFILHGIASGSFAGKKVQNAPSGSLLAPLFENASMGRKQITNIGLPQADGNAWLVPFTIHDHGNDNDYQITGKLAPFDNGLRFTEIVNIIPLLTQIGNESLE